MPELMAKQTPLREIIENGTRMSARLSTCREVIRFTAIWDMRLPSERPQLSTQSDFVDLVRELVLEPCRIDQHIHATSAGCLIEDCVCEWRVR